MEYLIWALAVGVLFLAAVAGAGAFGEMPEPVVDQFQPSLPMGLLGAEDIRAARFTQTRRGYSPAQVDQLLSRVANQLASQGRRTPSRGSTSVSPQDVATSVETDTPATGAPCA